MAKYKGPKLGQMTKAQRAARVQALIGAGNSAAIPDKYAPAELLAKRQSGGTSLEAKLANPGLRSKLPDSALTPALLALRKQNAMLKDPSYIQAKADAGEKYDPQISQLTATQNQLPSWYQAYQDTITRANKATTDADDAALREITARSQPAAQPMIAQNQQAITQAQADAALRGAILDPQAVKRAQDASAVNQAGVNNFANVLSALKASDVGLGENRGVAASAGLTAAQTALAHQLAAVRGQKANAQTSEYRQLSSQAAKEKAAAAQQDFTNRIAAKTLGINLTKTNADVAKTQAETNALNHPTPSYNKYGYSAKQWAALGLAGRQKVIKQAGASGGKKGSKTRPASGPGSLTSGDEQKQLSTVLKVAQAFQNGIPPTYTVTTYGQKVPKTPGAKTPAQVEKALKAQNVDPRVIRAAKLLAQGKDLSTASPAAVEALHALGLHVGGHFKVTR